MGLVCTQCGVRFYLPPGEQTWLEKRCGIRTPALPQFCIRCMEKRFARPVPKSEEARSRDGSTRLPSGQKMFPLLWAQEKVVYHGVRLKKPVALLGSDTAGIQFQRDKPGRTFFGRTAEEIPRGATTVSLEDSRSAKEEMLNGLESGVPLSGVLITIQHATRKVITFDASRHTVTLERGFATKLSSNTTYYIFQSFSGSTFPEPLCSNDSIAKERERESRAKAAALSKAKRAAQSVRTVQQQTILADIWGPPCKIESLGTNWNVELLTGPQKRLRSNCLNYVNALVTSAESGALVDHSETIRHARTLAFCMGNHRRCGEESVLLAFSENTTIMQKIVRMADTKTEVERLPKWQWDKQTSQSISRVVHLPVAVCVAEYSAGQLELIQKNQRTQFEKQALTNTDKEQRFKLKHRAQTTRTGGHINSMTSPDHIARVENDNILPDGTATVVEILHRNSGQGASSASRKSTDHPESLASPRTEPQPSRESAASPRANMDPPCTQKLHLKSQLAEACDTLDSKDERFLIVDKPQRCVLCFTLSGKLELQFGEGVLFEPVGIMIQSTTNTGTIVVSDHWLHALMVFDFSGVFQRKIGHVRGAGKGCFNRPSGLASGTEVIFVADTGNDRIQVLAADGSFLREFGGKGTSAGCFDAPCAVAFDRRASVLAVSEVGNARVQLLNEFGVCLHILKDFAWARDHSLPHDRCLVVDQSGTVEEVGMPTGLEFNEAGLLFVTDGYYHRVLVFNNEWEAVQKYGAGGGWDAVTPWLEPYCTLRRAQKALGYEKFAPLGGKADEEFNCPVAVAVGRSGNILVADTHNNRVQVFLS